MNTVTVLVTEWGEFSVPTDMLEPLSKVKWRKNRTGLPDMRTRAGKEWERLFREFSDRKRDELAA